MNSKAKRQNNASNNQSLDHPTYDMVQIFEDNGVSMKLEKKNISKHQLSHQEFLEKKNKLSGSRCMNYKENLEAIAKSRANHIIGLCKKMNELKVTTLDEIILIAIKDYGTPKEKRKTFASLMELFQKPVEKQSEIELPSQEELLYASPGKKRLLSKTYLHADDKRDKGYKSLWIGCHVTGCYVWQHTRYMGLIMPKLLKMFKWKCPYHMERPSKPVSVMKRKQ